MKWFQGLFGAKARRERLNQQEDEQFYSVFNKLALLRYGYFYDVEPEVRTSQVVMYDRDFYRSGRVQTRIVRFDVCSAIDITDSLIYIKFMADMLNVKSIELNEYKFTERGRISLLETKKDFTRRFQFAKPENVQKFYHKIESELEGFRQDYPNYFDRDSWERRKQHMFLDVVLEGDTVHTYYQGYAKLLRAFPAIDIVRMDLKQVRDYLKKFQLPSLPDPRFEEGVREINREYLPALTLILNSIEMSVDKLTYASEELIQKYLLLMEDYRLHVNEIHDEIRRSIEEEESRVLQANIQLIDEELDYLKRSRKRD